jgi:hypothetical protein
MPFKMVDRDQWFFQGESESLGIADTDKQRAREAGALGDSDGVDRLIGLSGIGERLTYHRNNRLQMLARS